MNTQVYQNVFRRRLPTVVAVTVIVALLAVLATWLLPEQYSVSVSIAVNVSDQQITPDYKFSRYYGTQASEKFSATVASWFQSPEVVQRIFERAELDPGTTSLRNLSKIFKSEPLAAQNVEVDFTTTSRDEATKLLGAIRAEVAQKTADLNQEEEAMFETIIAAPIVIPKERDYLLNGAVGLIVGVILGLALAAGREYWSRPKETL